VYYFTQKQQIIIVFYRVVFSSFSSVSTFLKYSKIIFSYKYAFFKAQKPCYNIYASSETSINTLIYAYNVTYIELY